MREDFSNMHFLSQVYGLSWLVVVAVIVILKVSIQ